MKVKEVIAKIHVYELKARLERVEKIAPKVIVANLKRQIEDYQAGNFKVNGMSRKFKVADEEVIKLAKADSSATLYETYKGQVGTYSKDTVIFRMATTKGTYYYDVATNKISDSICGLPVVGTNNWVELKCN